MSEADQFLLGGAPSAKFPTIGSKVAGVVIADPVIQQQTDFDTGELLTWQDGSPRNQLVVTLQTEEQETDEDDGARRVYIKANLQKAVTQAVRAVGAPGIRVGGHLSVAYTSNGPKVGRGLPPKLYSATYVPPEDDFTKKDDEEKPPF